LEFQVNKNNVPHPEASTHLRSTNKIPNVEGMFLNEPQLKTLKFMNEVKSKVDMNEFAQKIGLTPDQTMEKLKALAKEGFVTKSPTGYGITEKGKNALKATVQMPPEKSFTFYLHLNQPTSVSATNVTEFHSAVKKIDSASLEFHLYRGDFENWFRTSVNDAAFTKELELMKQKGLKGKALQNALAATLESHYSLQA
jgi:hypothetical protein